MKYGYMDTLNISYPEIKWRLINPNGETPDFDLEENIGASFSLDEIIYPDCFEAVEGTLPSKSELDAEVKRLQDVYDGQEYARNRVEEYPSLGDQMDMIYKDNKRREWEVDPKPDPYDIYKIKVWGLGMTPICWRIYSRIILTCYCVSVCVCVCMCVCV